MKEEAKPTEKTSHYLDKWLAWFLGPLISHNDQMNIDISNAL